MELSEDGNLTGMEEMTTEISSLKMTNQKIYSRSRVVCHKASVSRIIIERTLKLVTVTITTARPGMIIGKGGQDVDMLKEELKKVTGKDIQIKYL